MKAIPLLFPVLLLLLPGEARPAEPGLPLQQLNHRAFTAADGAPSRPYALAQTADGTLWMGGGTGLARFDGVRFVRYPSPAEVPLPSTNIATLSAAPDGGLWIGFRLGGASFLKGGQLTNYREREGLPTATLSRFAWARDGALWAVAGGQLFRLMRGRWEIDAEQKNLGNVLGLLIDRAGTQWLATENALVARRAGEPRFREVRRMNFYWNPMETLAEAQDGTIWAAGSEDLVRIDRPTDLLPGGVVTLRGVEGKFLPPIGFDDEGNLWAVNEGLLRVPFRELSGDGKPASSILQPERLSRAEGYTSEPTAFLKDREGNFWVGTSAGVDRFSHTNVERDLSACSDAAIAAGESGTLWVACENSASSARLTQMRNGAVVTRQDTPRLTVAYREPGGTVWFGGPEGLVHLENGRIVQMPLPAQARGSDVQALVREGSGAMWVSVVRKGLFRFLDGEWSEYGNLDALPRGPSIVATEDSVGSLWFGYPNNRVARVNRRHVQVFDTTHGLEVGNVLSILARGTEVWVGGDGGFARFDGARFVSIHNESEVPFQGISGIVQARDGDLWLNGIHGIAHISRHEIERVVRDPAQRVKFEIFDHLDGVPGTATQLRPQPSAIETTDGRIWFSTTAGLTSIDAARVIRNTLAPPVTIWSLSSGSKRYTSLGADLRLPIHTTGVQIEYTAGSLTVPERVRFRYKLEGSDRDWQNVGGRREALYTNLGPGHYTFKVIASNNDGVWNTTGASIDFTILPAFYQTTLFYAFCGLATVGVLAALYRVRMLQVAAQVRGRLEARLAERERIARDLHDTLLQGMQGLIWRFQAATDRIPSGESARQLMEESLDRADRLLGESRDRVKDLRPAASDAADLVQALAAEGEQLARLHPAKFSLSVQGTCRALHPIVREEGLLIGREALSNAFQHARAKDIEAEVTYDETALHFRIRDNGQGIAAEVLEGGRPGHFGFVGMRERAKKLGARLEVWSKAGAGTEVELRVPASVAYKPLQAAPRGTRSWLGFFRSSAGSIESI